MPAEFESVTEFRRFVLVQDHGTGLAVGSGRSVAGVSLIDALRSCSSILTKFGGHDQAAGVTLPVENIPEIQEQFAAFLCCNRPSTCEGPEAEADLDLSMVGRQFCEQLRSLEPFGVGNPAPLFRLQDAVVEPASASFVTIRQRRRRIKARASTHATGTGTALVAFNGTTASLVTLL